MSRTVPAGGLPAVVRIDRGKDFLSRTVGEALAGYVTSPPSTSTPASPEPSLVAGGHRPSSILAAVTQVKAPRIRPSRPLTSEVACR